MKPIEGAFDLTDEQKEKVSEKYKEFKELSQSCPGICPDNNPNKKVSTSILIVQRLNW